MPSTVEGPQLKGKSSARSHMQILRASHDRS